MVFNTSMQLRKHQFCISIYINSILFNCNGIAKNATVAVTLFHLMSM